MPRGARSCGMIYAVDQMSLQDLLDRERVRRDSYDLDGSAHDEALCLEPGTGGWIVLYSERGNRLPVCACSSFLPLVGRTGRETGYQWKRSAVTGVVLNVTVPSSTTGRWLSRCTTSLSRS